MREAGWRAWDAGCSGGKTPPAISEPIIYNYLLRADQGANKM